MMSASLERISHLINHLKSNSVASKATDKYTFILITGCSRGIGYGLVEYLLTHRPNYYVIASCRNPENAARLKSLIEKYPERSTIIKLDTSSNQSIVESAKRVSMITNTLHVLVNNAGISSSNHPWETVLDFDEKEMIQVLQTNVIGPAMLFKAYHKLLKKNQHDKPSKVMNISSGLGSFDMFEKTNQKTATSYRISKTGLNMLTRCQAAQIGLRDNIIVLSIAPGWIRTDMGTSYGKRKAKISVNDACKSICRLIENMNMKQHNGQFYDRNNERVSW